MKCTHDGYHCSLLILERHYMVTRAIPHPTDDIMIPEFIRWSNADDPPFPCLCKCESCEEWHALHPPEPLPVS